MTDAARYRTVRHLGAGGMGVVDLAYDAVRGETVARKRIQGADALSRMRFKREFRVVETLEHPRLVRLFELEEDEDGLFFTMEYVDGVDWTAYLLAPSPAEPISPRAQTEEGPIVALPVFVTAPSADAVAISHSPSISLGLAPTEQSLVLPDGHFTPPRLDASPVAVSIDDGHLPAAEWAPSGVLRRTKGPARDLVLERLRVVLPQLLEALGFLHEHGIAHCDLKPPNVLVTADGALKLLDFGVLATAAAPRPGFDNLLAGTVGYIAPERLRGEAATPAADLYALGVMLFTLFAGHMPFAGSPSQILLAQQHRKAPRLDVLGKADERIAEVVAALLSSQPAQRPSLAEVGAAFVVTSPGAPVPSMPASAIPSTKAPTSPSVMPAPLRRLTGRNDEVARLLAKFHEARGGAFHMVALTGPTGAGKSSVVAAFAEAVQGTGGVVLRGRARLAEFVAFNGVDDAIDDLAVLLRSPGFEALAMAADDAVAHAATVFPVLEGKAPTASVPRSLAFAALVEILRLVARGVGVVVTVDDIQWASSDALALLETLVLAAPPGVLVVATARSDTKELDRLHGLFELRGVTVEALAPLSDEAVRVLARDAVTAQGRPTPSDDVLSALVRAAEGRPLLAEVAARSFAARASVGDPREALAEAVAARSDEHRALLWGLLAAEAVMPLAQLATILDVPYTQAEVCARELVREGLLRWCTSIRAQRTVDFYHDTVRAAAAAKAPADLSAIHARLARALDGSPGVPEERIVRHLWAGGLKAQAGQRAIGAAQHAIASRAYGLAADLYRIALEAPGADEPTLLEARGRALDLAARYPEAAECFALLATRLAGRAAVDARLDEAHARLAANDVVRGRERLETALKDSGVGAVSLLGLIIAVLRFLIGPLRMPTPAAVALPASGGEANRAERDVRASTLVTYFSPLTGLAYLQRARDGFSHTGAAEQAAACDYILSYTSLFGRGTRGPVSAAARYERSATAWLVGRQRVPVKLRIMPAFLAGIRAQRDGKWEEAWRNVDAAVQALEDEGLGGNFECMLAHTHRVAIALIRQDLTRGREASARFVLASKQGNPSALLCHVEVTQAWLETLEGRFEEAHARSAQLLASWPKEPTFQLAYVTAGLSVAPPMFAKDPVQDRRTILAAVEAGKRFRVLDNMYQGMLAARIALVEAAAVCRKDPGASLRNVRMWRRRAMKAPPFNATGALRAEAYACDAVGQAPDVGLALLLQAETEAHALLQPIDEAIAAYQRGRRIGGDEGAALRAKARALTEAHGAATRVLEEDPRS